MIRVAQNGKLEVLRTTDQTDQSNVCACVAVQELGTEDLAIVDLDANLMGTLDKVAGCRSGVSGGLCRFASNRVLRNSR